MNVEKIMIREVWCCGPKATLQDVAVMMQQGGCGWIPVVDPTGRVKGVITDRDIARIAGETDQPLSALCAGDAMTVGVISCRAEDLVEGVADLMGTKRVRRIAVEDEDGRLSGVLSVDDLAVLAARPGNRDIAGLTTQRVVETLANIVAKPGDMEIVPRPGAQVTRLHATTSP
jgi:CBS domain-containing protein